MAFNVGIAKSLLGYKTVYYLFANRLDYVSQVLRI